MNHLFRYVTYFAVIIGGSVFLVKNHRQKEFSTPKIVERSGHLHPYAKSLRMVDLETGKDLFKIESTDFDDKIGVAQMSDFTSVERVPIRKTVAIS